MITDNFARRHNGPFGAEIETMLEKIGVKTLEQLINETVPSAIRLKTPMNLPKGLNEYQYLNHIRGIAAMNKLYKTYIGQGYYNTCLLYTSPSPRD